MHPVGNRDREHTLPALTSVAVVPARFHSSRLPGKPLSDIDGHPMIEHVYRRAARTPGVCRVIVATDDERIRSAVTRFGGEAVMTGAEHLSGTDRLAEVAVALDCDLVVNVQGDEPLIEPAAIAAALGPFAGAPGVLMTTLRRQLHSVQEFHDPAVVKVVVDRNGDALYFSRSPIPHGRMAATATVPAGAFKHVGVYVYRREFLLRLARLEPTPLERSESLEQLRALEHGYRIRTVETAFDSIGVDTAEDLDRVRRLLSDIQTP